MLDSPNTRLAGPTASPFQEFVAMASGHKHKQGRGGSGVHPRHGPQRSGMQFVPTHATTDSLTIPAAGQQPKELLEQAPDEPRRQPAKHQGEMRSRPAPEPIGTSSPFGIEQHAPDGTPATPPQARAEATEVAATPDGGENSATSNGELSRAAEARPPVSQTRSSRFQHFSTLEPPRAGAGAQSRSEYGAAPSDEDDDEIDLTSRPDVRGEVGPLIDSLKALFEQDRGVSASGGTSRCGLCYLHFPLSELEYREREGYYICGHCARALGSADVMMVRRQQR